MDNTEGSDIVSEFRAFAARLQGTKGVKVQARVGAPASPELIELNREILHPEVLKLAAVADGLSLRWHFTKHPNAFREGLGGAFKLPTIRQFVTWAGADQQGYEYEGVAPQKLDAEAVGAVPSLLGNGDDLHVFDLDGYAQPCTVETLAEVVRFGISSFFVCDWGSLLDASVEADPDVLQRVRTNATKLKQPVPLFAAEEN